MANINVYGTFNSMAEDQTVAKAAQIYDDNKLKNQQTINQELEEKIDNLDFNAENIGYDRTQTPDLGSGDVQSAIEALDGKVEQLSLDTMGKDESGEYWEDELHEVYGYSVFSNNHRIGANYAGTSASGYYIFIFPSSEGDVWKVEKAVGSGRWEGFWKGGTAYSSITAANHLQSWQQASGTFTAPADTTLFAVVTNRANLQLTSVWKKTTKTTKTPADIQRQLIELEAGCINTSALEVGEVMPYWTAASTVHGIRMEVRKGQVLLLDLVGTASYAPLVFTDEDRVITEIHQTPVYGSFEVPNDGYAYIQKLISHESDNYLYIMGYGGHAKDMAELQEQFDALDEKVDDIVQSVDLVFGTNDTSQSKTGQLKNGTGDNLFSKNIIDAETLPITFLFNAAYYGYKFYINSNTNKWVKTSVAGAERNCYINDVKKGDLIDITPNSDREAAIAFLSDISNMANNAVVNYVAWKSGVQLISNRTTIECQSDCYLYVLNYASSSTTVRMPSDVTIHRQALECSATMKQHTIGTLGCIYADNIADKFVFQQNIVFKANKKYVTLTAGTEIPYNFLNNSGQIQYLCYNPISESYKNIPWSLTQPDDILLANYRVQNYKVTEDLGGVLQIKIIDDTWIGYQGEKPIISDGKFRRMAFATLPTFTGSYTGLHQAMGIHGKYVVLLTYNDNVTPKTSTAVLYNLLTKEKLAEINLPYSTLTRPHGNSCTFGNTYKTANSILPLMYVSQWEENSERGCLVYDIQLNNGVYSATLVQSIVPSLSNDIFGAGASDWCVDADGDYIYSIAYKATNGAYTEDNDTNPTMICKFALPAVSTPSVTLTETDIIKHFTTESTPFRQSCLYCNGKLIIQAGIINYPTWMWLKFVDVISHKITTKMSLVDFGGEPEGLGIFCGELVMGWRNDQNIYRIDFK